MKLAYLFIVLVALPSVFPSAEDKGKVEDGFEVEDSVIPEVPTESRSRFAMLDDVRLLANGLLQLGHSLREFVHKTKGQINDIFQKLSIFDRSFSQLSEVTTEIKEKEEELKKTTTFLKANNEEIKSLSLEMSSKMNSIMQERSQLQNKVGGLEEKLSGLSQSLPPVEQLNEISALREVIDAQDKSITDLLRAVREQNDQLNYQKNKIKSLEERLNYDSFQETADKTSDSHPETPILQYLSSNSTNSSFDIDDLPADCSEIFKRGERSSGMYPIKPNQSEPFYVYCEMTADGGSTVIQTRRDGSVDFDQTWEKYENGFGDLEREFWLGLRKIHAISSQGGDSILRIELEDWKQGRRSVEYRFTLEGPASQYALQLTHLSGDLPDAMSNHTGTRFSTKDRDNDNKEDSNCAQDYTGGWWFNACGDANLNGKYIHIRPKGRTERRRGLYWKPGRGNSYSVRATKMSVRPLPIDSSSR
ncbi:angiopoietin-related protein 3-like [Megalops cyprinoides]|uniref:angiopoietin-related protein 3-like n=1 Tax=Megalops cyprinoides TaxID=118141 RepID=UPI001863C396|nr:angiopoietin-related protein 3-like [Megalops cyprinoides]